jgi:hypothetical protein
MCETTLVPWVSKCLKRGAARIQSQIELTSGTGTFWKATRTGTAMVTVVNLGCLSGSKTAWRIWRPSLLQALFFVLINSDSASGQGQNTRPCQVPTHARRSHCPGFWDGGGRETDFQDRRFLGSSCFASRGIPIISHRNRTINLLGRRVLCRPMSMVDWNHQRCAKVISVVPGRGILVITSAWLAGGSR